VIFCIFQDVPEGRGRKSKLLLIESTKMCIKPVKEIITDEFSHRGRSSRV